MKSVFNPTVEQIESWPLNEEGFHVSPEGVRIKLGRQVTIGKECTLFDGARMGDRARMGDGASMGARASMGEKVKATTVVTAIHGSKYVISWFSPTQIAIGCTVFTPDEWLEEYESLAEDEDFTADQVKEYRSYFDFLIAQGPSGMTMRSEEELEADRKEFQAKEKAHQEEMAKLRAEVTKAAPVEA